MGVFFALFFLLVKKICMLFTHISISIQTHTHTQIHMPTQRAEEESGVWGGGYKGYSERPLGIFNISKLKYAAYFLYCIQMSSVSGKSMWQLRPADLPLSPSASHFPLQHSHWCVCVCVFCNVLRGALHAMPWCINIQLNWDCCIQLMSIVVVSIVLLLLYIVAVLFAAPSQTVSLIPFVN